MDNLITVRHLVNQFGTHRVHDGLNLDVRRNEILGIVGGSGTGKSVLLRTLLGLNQPFSGEIRFNGQELSKLSPAEWLTLKRHWGVMFQRGALFSSLTVAENIQYPLREFSGLTERESKALMYIRLKMVGLDAQVADKFPAELSGGMTKRVALARALALDPVVLFLDEPTSGLDPVSAAEFDQLILSLHANLELTVVMVTHDMDSLFSTCERIALLVDKKIITGTHDELLSNPHPGIQQYFAGDRVQAIIKAR
ncbi:MAG: ATP-binding cassette domain-containing protein [Thiolinea sp.]